MATYHQMGHNSWNLIEDVGGFAGVVLSPVNQTPAEVVARLAELGPIRANLEVVLDPQFYQPKSDRGHLASWDHWGDDVETADLSDQAWWETRCAMLAAAAKTVGADAVCSPAILPRAFDDPYYTHVIECASFLAKAVAETDIEVLVTAIVDVNDLAQKERPEHIASILTAAPLDRAYLVFHDRLYPRTNRTDQPGMIGAAKLVRLLERAGMRVMVAFSGLDVLVWKGVGASDIATGKFFNLRRFVPGRWEDPQDGGRNIPYWTDDDLIAWLREDDLRALDGRGLVNRATAAGNPFSTEILKIIDAGEGTTWLAISWRQYLWWFRHLEQVLTNDQTQAMRMLIHADATWARLVHAQIYLRDRENTGEWVRPWMNAITQSLPNESQ